MPSRPTKAAVTAGIRIPSLRAQITDVPEGTAEQLKAFVESHQRLLVITGAGLSTGSGIPAYRNHTGQWLRRTPIFYQDFMRSPIARRRYWARSYIGWQPVAQAKPNQGHLGLMRLEQAGHVHALITQNVDGLHQRAGSQSVIELHGQLGRVRCLDCNSQFRRDTIQQRLTELNPHWSPDVQQVNPDGDVDLDDRAYPGFQVADCSHCQGRLKPDVVFFGESVTPSVTQTIQDACSQCDGALVVGSSLVVMSGYRVVKQMHALNKPIVAINQGRTRADDLLSFKIQKDCVTVLDAISQSASAS
jgi:NAD-dependent SIR2 family protein deacetylase